jgi:hypothetical protein
LVVPVRLVPAIVGGTAGMTTPSANDDDTDRAGEFRAGVIAIGLFPVD